MQQNIECKYCGAPIDISLAVGGVAECAYCHRKHILPKSSDNNAVYFLVQGEHDLDTCKFDDAFAAFQKAAEYDNGEPEAYFGMALAEFRVQYIKDEVNSRLQAVCHDISERAFAQNKNYKKALELATYEQREEYTKRAEEIDYIRNEFYKLKNSGLDYDCFICVKVTDEHGGKTKDYKTADDLYFHLRGKGYNPFFSEREMAGRAGVDYEALILYALHTSECMLVVCSDESYLNTPWVKNEYTRFIELIADKQKEDDSITIVFGGAPIERLPGRSGRIQGVDIGRADAYGKIEQYVESHTPMARAKRESAAANKNAEEERLKQQLEELKAQQEKARLELESKLAAVKNSSAPQANNSGSNTAALLVRVKQFMSAGDFNKAKEYCERVLDMEPNNAEAWWLLLLVDLKVTNAENWQDAVKSMIVGITDIVALKKHSAYINASRYASGYEPFLSFDSLLDELSKDLNELKELKNFKRDFEIENGVLVKYKGKNRIVVIPDDIKSIGDSAFQFCDNLTAVEIPSSVVNIGLYAFAGCRSLANIEIPNSVTSIGDGAFSGCSSLTSIAIPNMVSSIKGCTFYSCSKLKTVEIPNDVTCIEGWAFRDCVSLIGIEIPNSVTSIGDYAFFSCSSLKSIAVPNSIAHLGESPFGYCQGLQEITIPQRFQPRLKNIFYHVKSVTGLFKKTAKITYI